MNTHPCMLLRIVALSFCSTLWSERQKLKPSTCTGAGIKKALVKREDSSGISKVFYASNVKQYIMIAIRQQIHKQIHKKSGLFAVCYV